jgi:hypothetical protein
MLRRIPEFRGCYAFLFQSVAVGSALRAAVSTWRSVEDSPTIKLYAKEAVSWDRGEVGYKEVKYGRGEN